MKKLILTAIMLIVATTTWGYKKQDMLTKKASYEQLKSSLILDQKWVPFPAYADRAGWDRLTGEYKKQLIEAGEKKLNYEWKVIPAMAYIEYERSGNRNIMQDPYGANNTALASLFLAELAEGKGRFVEQIINGVWHTCDMASWGLSAHLAGVDRRRPLPNPKFEILELTQGDLSNMLSWIYYYLKPQFDKVDTMVAERLRGELQRRMLDSWMKNSNFWWQAFNATPTTMVNNWNPWCNFNVLMCYMLLENDREKLARAVYRTMESVDKYIDYSKTDGACEEGPSYWGHAAGKMYDYLQALYDLTGGKVSVFDEPQIRAMGEYIVTSYVGDGWVVNFADASAKGGGSGELIYRYGKATGSHLMMNYAATITNKEKIAISMDIFRTLETLDYANEMAAYEKQPLPSVNTWYPETEFCFVNDTKSGFFLAMKGGFNDESHNHNDAGTFSLYLDNTPVFIDAGVGTYTRQTFSSERYTIWTMQSEYHNVPKINGTAQKNGKEYLAKDAKFDAKKRQFSLDIAGAYPKEADVKSYKRSYTPSGNNIVIEDNFVLNNAKAPNQINFLTWGKVDIAVAGKVAVEVGGKKVVLEYDPKQFKALIETVKLDDPRLSSVWGGEIYRVSLDALQTVRSGKYVFVIKK